MNEALDFLSRHGPLVLFLAVFVEQVGVPLPAAPWLLAAGALIGAGKEARPDRAGVGHVRLVAGGYDLVLSWTAFRQSRVKTGLPHFAGAGLVRPANAGHIRSLRNAGCNRGEVHSWPEHSCAADGRQFGNSVRQIFPFRWIGLTALRRLLRSQWSSIQPSIGTGSQRARKSRQWRARPRDRAGRSLHRLQILPAAATAGRIAYGANHSG